MSLSILCISSYSRSQVLQSMTQNTQSGIIVTSIIAWFVVIVIAVSIMGVSLLSPNRIYFLLIYNSQVFSTSDSSKRLDV